MDRFEQFLLSTAPRTRWVKVLGIAAVLLVAVYAVGLVASGLIATVAGTFTGLGLYFTGVAAWRTCIDADTRQRLDPAVLWPLPRRRKIAASTLVLGIIAALFVRLDSVLPYALGGALVISAVLGILTMARATPHEAEQTRRARIVTGRSE